MAAIAPLPDASTIPGDARPNFPAFIGAMSVAIEGRYELSVPDVPALLALTGELEGLRVLVKSTGETAVHNGTTWLYGATRRAADGTNNAANLTSGTLPTARIGALSIARGQLAAALVLSGWAGIASRGGWTSPWRSNSTRATRIRSRETEVILGGMVEMSSGSVAIGASSNIFTLDEALWPQQDVTYLTASPSNSGILCRVTVSTVGLISVVNSAASVASLANVPLDGIRYFTD